MSKIYESNPYVYEYFGFQINVNVSTLSLAQYKDDGIVNSISGVIHGTTHFADSAPEPYDAYHSYYSLALVKNIIEFSANEYKKWKGVILDSSWIHSKVLKFRLIDL